MSFLEEFMAGLGVVEICWRACGLERHHFGRILGITRITVDRKTSFKVHFDLDAARVIGIPKGVPLYVRVEDKFFQRLFSRPTVQLACDLHQLSFEGDAAKAFSEAFGCWAA